MTFTTYINR